MNTLPIAGGTITLTDGTVVTLEESTNLLHELNKQMGINGIDYLLTSERKLNEKRKSNMYLARKAGIYERQTRTAEQKAAKRDKIIAGRDSLLRDRNLQIHNLKTKLANMHKSRHEDRQTIDDMCCHMGITAKQWFIGRGEPVKLPPLNPNGLLPGRTVLFDEMDKYHPDDELAPCGHPVETCNKLGCNVY